jgi:hypothetical protein
VLDVFVWRDHIHYPNQEHGPGRISQIAKRTGIVIPPPNEIEMTSLLFMGDSKWFDRFLLLFRNAVNLLDRPSLRILDLSPIQSARYLSQAFFCDREQNRGRRCNACDTWVGVLSCSGIPHFGLRRCNPSRRSLHLQRFPRRCRCAWQV